MRIFVNIGIFYKSIFGKKTQKPAHCVGSGSGKCGNGILYFGLFWTPPYHAFAPVRRGSLLIGTAHTWSSRFKFSLRGIRGVMCCACSNSCVVSMNRVSSSCVIIFVVLTTTIWISGRSTCRQIAASSHFMSPTVDWSRRQSITRIKYRSNCRSEAVGGRTHFHPNSSCRFASENRFDTNAWTVWAIQVCQAAWFKLALITITNANKKK